MTRRILAATIFVLLCACGGGDSDTDGDGDAVGGADGGGGAGEPISEPQNFCDLMTQAVCDKLMTCYSEQERTDLGLARTEAECLEDEQESCSTADVCDPGQTYDSAHAGGCVVEFADMSCDDFRRSDAEPGPECSAVCQ